jgi:YVTN family beta-propeller protein
VPKIALSRLSLRSRNVVAAAVVLCIAVVGVASAAVAGLNPFGTYTVGQQVNGAILLPSNQWISPIGDRTLVDNVRLVSSTLSPDGTMMAALSWNNFNGALSMIDVKTGKVVQQVGALGMGDSALGDDTVAADGPLYSPDGKTLWVPQTADLLRFTVNPDGTVSPTPTATISLCGAAASSPACSSEIGPTNPDGAWLPSGMALSRDGNRLYVALNGNNSLGVIDTATNQLAAKIPVGNAPRQVVVDGDSAFVSNEGGRAATPGQFTNLSDGTPIVSDRSAGAATTGTVSVVDLRNDTVTNSIAVGLQPTALYLNGSALFVANSNDDSMSVINTTTQQVAQTIHTNPVPGAKVGSYANAITMPDDGHVLVSIGRDNAIAVYRYSGLSAPLRFQGLLPTDWYPVQVQPDPALGKSEIVVTNDKGIGDRGSTPEMINQGPGTKPAPTTVTGSGITYGGNTNTYNDTGSVTRFALPSDAQLARYTKIVFQNNAWNQIDAVNSGVGDSVPSVIPRRIGGHSPIKHVFVIVKENRTYDQVLGDLAQGDGDPSFAQFGQTITPNQHALADRFGDLDNFYDEGTLSADGHNWIVQADANDYVEKEFGAFYRSYPAQGGDALAYQRDGFLWNAAQRAGLSVADFGEYANFFTAPSPSAAYPASGGPRWIDWYKDSQILEGKASGPLPVPIKKYTTYADIPSLNAIIDPYYPKFDLDVPDQYRVDIWNQAFRKYQRSGHLPDLTLMWVPDDHTAGVCANPGVDTTCDPDPIASVADNDLAVGRIVDTISHSRWWKSSAIFVLEDDPQNGIDHVDGHRSVLWTISPYSKPGVNDSYYSQINVVRTTEQILGIKPMNQEDHAAVPMYNAFTNKPNFAPYNVVPNQVPLTLGTTYPSTAATAAADRATTVPPAERKVYAAWTAWSRYQRFNGHTAREDVAKPAQLNRLDWYSAHGWQVAYPGDPKIYPPDQVPGRNLPAQDIDG